MHIQDMILYFPKVTICPLSIFQALLPAGTFALGVAASSLVRQKRTTLREEETKQEAEVNAVANIGRLLENFHQKYGDED